MCQSVPVQRATVSMTVPSGKRKSPEANSAPSATRSRSTFTAFVPSCCQPLPSQMAAPCTGCEPELPAGTPATRCPFQLTTALTYGLSPSPTACHAAPSQIAIECASTVPACSKNPAATNESPSKHSAFAYPELVPATPPPTDCQLEPSHRAMPSPPERVSK